MSRRSQSCEQHRNAGRVYPHERDDDDVSPIIGGDLPVPRDLEAKYNATLHKEICDATRQDYRRRIRVIVNFWKENHKDYYELGVRNVDEEEQQRESCYFFGGRYKQDIIYTGINVDFLLSFLVSTKFKKSNERADEMNERNMERLKGVRDMQKYMEAIMWGAKTKGEKLPYSFYERLDRFYAGYKKEYAEARKHGRTKEQVADPINELLYKKLLEWSIKENNPFVWFWTICQWNFKARSASIGELRFHNFCLGMDSIIGKYDDSKMDKQAERLAEKNLFANPHEWKMCLWTGLGIWCSLESSKLSLRDTLFLARGAKEGSASQKYCRQLVGIVQSNQHQRELESHMDPNRFNPYGLRKGSATHAVAGTTQAPSLTAIARHGEWKIGTVLDCYWHFGNVGDYYLGRILAGLNPNKSNFAILPPHFTFVDPNGNEHVKHALKITYGEKLLETRKEFVPILIRCLASIVYHSTNLIKCMLSQPGRHFLNKVAILHHHELLNNLKRFVTIEPTPGVMEKPTGIPPHIEIGSQLATLISDVKGLISKTGKQTTELVGAISDAMEKHAWESGHLTAQRLETMLTDFQKKSMESFHEKLNQMETRVESLISSGRTVDNTGTIANSNEERAGSNTGVVAHQSSLFYYDGKYYGVPKGFKFPSTGLKEGLRFWLYGQTSSLDGEQRIRPFRKLKGNLLPPPLQNTFKVGWNIFRYLEKNVSYPGLPPQTELMEEDEFVKFMDACTTLLKERISYCFQGGGEPISCWKVATWSTKVTRATIEKYGTESDKDYLAPATNANRPRPSAQGKRKSDARMKDKPLYPRFQQQRKQQGEQREKNKRARKGNNQQVSDSNSNSGDAFAAAFPIPEHLEAKTRYVPQDILDSTRDDVAQSRKRQMVSKDGTQLYTSSMRKNMLEQNHGDSSSISREQYKKRILEALDSNKKGHCTIEGGCKFPQLAADHHCYKCRAVLHNLCVQSVSLQSKANELNLYCSQECKGVD